jgi:hypothetical protein
MMNVASNLRGSLLWVLRANVIVVVIDLIVLAVWLLLQSANLVAPVRKDFFTVLLLLESALVFLAGGAVAMSTSIFPSKAREYFFRSKEKWSPEKHKKSEARANLYILVGILLFLESIGLTFFL